MVSFFFGIHSCRPTAISPLLAELFCLVVLEQAVPRDGLDCHDVFHRSRRADSAERSPQVGTKDKHLVYRHLE